MTGWEDSPASSWHFRGRLDSQLGNETGVSLFALGRIPHTEIVTAVVDLYEGLAAPVPPKNSVYLTL